MEKFFLILLIIIPYNFIFINYIINIIIISIWF